MTEFDAAELRALAEACQSYADAMPNDEDPHELANDRLAAVFRLGSAHVAVLALLREVDILHDLNEGLERQIDAEAKHAALGPGESCDVCTHMEVEEMARESERLHDEFMATKARAEAAEAEVARLQAAVADVWDEGFTRGQESVSLQHTPQLGGRRLPMLEYTRMANPHRAEG